MPRGLETQQCLPTPGCIEAQTLERRHVRTVARPFTPRHGCYAPRKGPGTEDAKGGHLHPH